MFTVVGRIRGKPYSVSWDNGKLEGDKLAVDIATIYAESHEGVAVGPVGQYTENKHLSDPLSALFILTDKVFSEVDRVDGDLPEVDEVPKNAVV